jgi:hypothetical protein
MGWFPDARYKQALTMTNSRDPIVTDEDFEDWLKLMQARQHFERLPDFSTAIFYGIVFSAPVWGVVIWAVYHWMHKI